MIRLKVTDREGGIHAIEVATGGKLMEAVRDAGIESYIGLCGGFASCGTCHCYVDDRDAASLGPGAQPEDEEAVLEGSLYTRPNSRLSCQIQFSDELDGLKVTIAPED